MKKVFIVFEDPSRLEFISKAWVRKAVAVDDCFGIIGWEGFYKDIPVTLLYSENREDALSPRLEDLFVFGRADLIIYVGSCYPLLKTNINAGDLLLVTETKAAKGADGFEKPDIHLDESVKNQALEIAKNLDLNVVEASCFTVGDVTRTKFKPNELGCNCFDTASYPFYYLAKDYSKHLVCLYLAIQTAWFNKSHYSVDKPIDKLDNLIRWALELSISFK